MKKIMFNDKYGLTKAVLKGRKTQTRRLITLTLHEGNLQNDNLKDVGPDEIFLYEGVWLFKYKRRVYELPKVNCPKYKVGEIIAVAQSYRDIDPIIRDGKNQAHLEYMDSLLPEMKKLAGWANKMFVKPELMPHQILITKVRVERLQDISNDDCLAEGILKEKTAYGEDSYNIKIKNKAWYYGFDTPREAYAALIDKVSSKGTWQSNPYVFVYDFKLIK